MQRIRFIAITALALLAPQAAFAQPAEAPATAPALTPPKLVKAAQPVYPAAQLESGASATVALVLTLDDTGKVTDVSVATSAGEDFDQAAIDAAKQLEFTPAQRDGSPVASKIPFRIQFEPQAPAPAPVPVPVPVPAASTAATAAPTAPSDALDIDVEGQRPPREPTQHSITAQEITKIPGTNGDALRAIGNMPGVARVGAFDGLLIVRGSSPRDTQVFIDGTSVPLIYHFGGLSSVVPSEMLERIDFYPGNFGPQYGRATGGIVDAGLRSPKKDKLHGLLQVDLLDARVVLEAPINKSTRFMIGGRRSWLDAWLGPVLRGAGASVSAAPVYYDYQAMLEHDLTRDTTLRLLVFGSDDRMKLTLNAPDARDPAAGGAFGLHQGFVRVQGRIDTRPTNNVRWTTTISAGQGEENTVLGGMYLDVKYVGLQLRSDVRAKLASSVTVIAGIDAQRDSFDASYRLPQSSFEDDSDTGPTFGKPLTTLEGKGALTRPAGYAMLELTPFASLKLLPGVRADYDEGTKKWTADPRIAARWDVHAGFPRTTLKAGAGIFHQPPEAYESIAPFGNGGRFFGWLAYTLSRSERKDSPAAAYYRYDYDQTHILTALGSYKLGRGWQLGARFRYVTGSPYTPELGGTVDYDAGTYAPVTSTARNSRRLPAFHQLDVRVDKTWQFQTWAFSAYLDVQNAYNHQNTESISYNFDYSQTAATHGLPILPIVGIRGEL